MNQNGPNEQLHNHFNTREGAGFKNSNEYLKIKTHEEIKKFFLFRWYKNNQNLLHFLTF